MSSRRCCYKESTKDMNLRRIFLSILSFGVAGLLVFMYFHAWIEEQPIVLRYKIQQEQSNKAWNQPTKFPGKFRKSFKTPEAVSYRAKELSNGTTSKPTTYAFNRSDVSLRKKLSQQRKMRNLLLKKLFEPVINLPVGQLLNRSLATDDVQEQRRQFLANFCKKYYTSKHRTSLIRLVSRVYVEDKHRLLYCEVPKAGCSNWKRVLMVLNGLASNPHNISHNFVHYGKHLRRLDSYSLQETYQFLSTFTKVLFVRDPMERLVSAFRDKFEHPNVYYHPVFGKAILKKYRANASAEALSTGAGVTFSEFVHYLLDPQKPVGMDIHWEPISKLCSPCLINYDFIGKFENLENDANSFLKLIGAPLELQFPSFKDRHSTDERTTAAVVKQYLLQISPLERQQIYNFYYLDYLMFNYSKPHF
ncbi:carbohydrate sulfotransferase 9-like isoform X1 [Carcharodon carcharias]|uniref:carbohydrate sulfotransferase 9-like isoform X1 n=1 Tax=Carcharodon carcharias TaxID=13397 RepID=UPI001B7EC3A4|nr:carbohydrate sulfotransferase 9-like isoform X1 [Carcharodon carcharias]